MNSKQKLYLSSAIALVFLLGLALGPGWLLLNSIKNKALALAEKRQSMEALYKDWHNLEQARRSLKSEVDSDWLDGSLLEKENALDFILELEAMSKKAGCQQEIRSVNPPQEKKGAEQNYLSFQATLWCPFSNFFKFLLYLENMKYFAQIKNIRISRLEPTEQPNLAAPGPNDIEAVLEINALTK